MRVPTNPTAVLLLIVGLLLTIPAAAYETDQYTPRGLALEDSAELLNARVNAAIADTAAGWRGESDPARFSRQIYKRLGGRHWVDRLERWAMRSAEVERFHPKRRGSVYSGLPIWATRVISLFGVGPTIKVDGVLLGTDKLGHFLSQGWKYHKRFLKAGSVERAVRLGNRNEASIFGSPATGTFSNADLVANYEGLLFYRSLFEDGIVGDFPAIIEWTADGGARVARPFDFRHHVNDYWDEALNPSRYDRLLSGVMLKRLREFCPMYREDPAIWVSPTEGALEERYAVLGLRDGTTHRLDKVCSSDEPEAPIAPSSSVGSPPGPGELLP